MQPLAGRFLPKPLPTAAAGTATDVAPPHRKSFRPTQNNLSSKGVYHMKIYNSLTRKKEEFKTQPAIAYIEPSASSACELVAEILEQSMPQGQLKSDEAELMFAGILLDTKQFSQNAGARTFSAALYLRAEGANPAEAQALFKTDLSDFMREARFTKNIKMLRNFIAIAINDEDGNSYPDDIAAAKAADRLLTIDGVQASFTLCRINDAIVIKARSAGYINVQLIMENLGGGGHFDSAACQMRDVDMKEAEKRLREAIEEYLSEL
jgi:c-di-AMP phosphodiesterase-like protein